MSMFYDGLTPYIDTVNLILKEMKHKHFNIIAKSSLESIAWLENWILDIGGIISSSYEIKELSDNEKIQIIIKENLCKYPNLKANKNLRGYKK